MAKKNELHMEETFAKLETLVNTLEDDEVQLADALAAFEEGIKLVGEAQKILEKTEQRVQKLLEKDGKLVSTPFTEEADE